MGYEAYKLTAKFQALSVNDMTEELIANGAVLVEKFGNTTTMELVTEYGVLDLVLNDVNHVNTRFSPSDKIILNIRFAKSNNVRIASEMIRLLKKLAARFDVVYIRDNEAKKDIDLSVTAGLIQSITYAKYDFEYHFPIHRQQVRCREVFCGCSNAYPLMRREAVF
jgi:hypothetical protein